MASLVYIRRFPVCEICCRSFMPDGWSMNPAACRGCQVEDLLMPSRKLMSFEAESDVLEAERVNKEFGPFVYDIGGSIQ